ncbi:helix-turn-helix transcriptional regulator [Cryomorphaceae bacterium]|nr:helix-turn-helix transcriptional regulator [Cryomorphaceae bacterium]
MNYVYAASGAIIAIFVFLILKKRKKAIADYLLILVNLLIGCFILADVLVNWKLTSETVIFQNAIPLLLFPVFVFYLLQFTHAKKHLAKTWYLLFLPFVLFCALCFIDHYLLQNYKSAESISEHFNAPSIWYQLIFKGSQLTFIAVLIYTLRLLNQFEEELKQGFSTIETIDVRWLRHFTWIYLGSISITFILFLGQNLGLIPFEVNQVFGIVYGILTVSMFYMNYQGIQHYTISQVYSGSSINDLPTEKKANSDDTDHSETKSIQLTDEEQKLEAEILKQIEEHQLYLDPKFSLDELAGHLGKSRHQVSRVINSKEHRSFYDLINRYRVDHLKNLLKDPSNSSFTILSLGLDSGFNSKASLNRIFKNISGLTPKQYLDQKSQSVG